MAGGRWGWPAAGLLGYRRPVLFLEIFRVFKYPDIWDPFVVSKKPYVPAFSTDKWVLLVRFTVYWLEIHVLHELQLVYKKMIDFST
jgi:hypothetical protein